MTIEEYLKGVQEIYYQMSAIVDGKQILVSGRAQRLTDVLNTIRFSAAGTTLSLPAMVKMDKEYPDRAAITFNGMRLVIWPTGEAILPQKEEG